MRRLALVMLSVAITLAFTTAASADPSHNINEPLTFACDDGQNVVINPGTVTNQSRQAFVISSDGTISSTSIFVINYLALTDSNGTYVLFEIAHGLEGLVTCTTGARRRSHSHRRRLLHTAFVSNSREGACRVACALPS
jgi:hypothetical protein